MPSLHDTLSQLYTGDTGGAHRFRFAMIGFDILAIAYFLLTSVVEHQDWFYLFDAALGLVMLADLLARLWIAKDRFGFFLSISSLVDLLVVVTFLLPLFAENLAFLRVLRTLRLLRSYHVLQSLRRQWPIFAKNEEIIQSVINLLVFIFFITALVYVFQHQSNPAINSYVDALYFTVTTLTTTGFGDITLTGNMGHLLSVVIMVVGVSLFLRLVQTIFRPAKVRYACQSCGLSRHDPDAVHCKHCGSLIKIETEGA